MNVDRLQEKIPQATVVGSPVAGYFFPGMNDDAVDCPEYVDDYPHWAAGEHGSEWCDQDWVTSLWNSKNFSADCAEDLGGDYWKCTSAHTAAPYIKAPLFWGQNWLNPSHLTPTPRVRLTFGTTGLTAISFSRSSNSPTTHSLCRPANTKVGTAPNSANPCGSSSRLKMELSSRRASLMWKGW